jgi:redox-sensitive bicupin YhaK (pirin superfamily)
MVAEVKEFADAGGLMTYGPSEAWLSGRLVVVVAHVDSEHALQMRPVQDEKPVETLRPHRPITYVLAGTVEHGDSMGTATASARETSSG